MENKNKFIVGPEENESVVDLFSSKEEESPEPVEPIKKKRTKKIEPKPEPKPVKSVVTVPAIKCPQCRRVDTVTKLTYGIKCKRCGFFPWEQVDG